MPRIVHFVPYGRDRIASCGFVLTLAARFEHRLSRNVDEVTCRLCLRALVQV